MENLFTYLPIEILIKITDYFEVKDNLEFGKCSNQIDTFCRKYYSNIYSSINSIQSNHSMEKQLSFQENNLMDLD